MGVEETAPSRPEEDQREAKKSAQEEGEKEAAPAPVLSKFRFNSCL